MNQELESRSGHLHSQPPLSMAVGPKLAARWKHLVPRSDP